MRAVVLDAPGPATALQIREVPKPEPRAGWVLLRVEAFGLNRSELHSRLGLAGPDVTFPRVLGIEAAGIIEAAPGTDLAVGSKAVAMMGGMGRSFDGGYAEYTLVPARSVMPVEVYAMSDIVRAHDDMEHDRVMAKQVVLTRGEP